jgi:hypothetical protein
MDPKFYPAFNAHLKKHMRGGVCPVCGSNSWSTHEGSLMGVAEVPPGQFMASTAGIVPTAILMCNTCYFIRQFALVPIMRDFLGYSAAESENPDLPTATAGKSDG